MEDELREMMRARAEDVSPTGDPVAKVRQRRDALGADTHGPRPLMAALAVAAVVAAVVIPLWLVRHDAAPSGQPTVSTSSTLGTAAVSTPTTPAATPSDGSCVWSNSFVVTKTTWSAQPAVVNSAVLAAFLTVHNTGAACTLRLPPQVTLVSADGSTRVVTTLGRTPRHQPRLATGQSVQIWVRIAWPTRGKCPQAFRDITSLDLTAGGAVATIPVLQPGPGPSGQWPRYCQGRSFVQVILNRIK